MQAVQGSVDWTTVLDSLIAVLPATLSAYFAYKIKRAIKTPSGDSIGTQVEQANHLAAANVALTQKVHEKVTNGPGA